MTTETRRVLSLLEQGIESAIASLGVNITAELIERTPVDLGWARANWVPSVGQPFLGNADDIDEAARRAAVPAQSARQQTATAALFAYQVERGPLFISNNVPYIVALNEGSSDQAPSGFVQESILAGIRSLDSRNFS